MKILSNLRSLVGKKSAEDEHALAEKPEIAKAKKEKPISHYFILQTLEALKKLEIDGGTFICSSPDFECYFKKKYMPLFEEKKTYIKIASDKSDNVTHVCGLLPRLQHEKDREKIEDEQMTLSKMPDCLLSHAIAEASFVPTSNRSRASNVGHQGQTASTQQQIPKANNIVHQGQAASTQQQTSKAKSFVHQGQAATMRQRGSNVVFDPNMTVNSLKGVEKEWLNSMHASLIDSEYEILLHLLQHSITTYGFKEKIERFLNTKQELEPGSCRAVINSFNYLAREFQFSGQTLSVAQIGSSVDQMFHLKPRETFSVIVELFFCQGYEREIKGYTTGFIELT